MEFWKDRRVHFAIGLATVLVACKWLFTGTLLSSADAIDEGQTGAGVTAIVPIAIDLFIWAMIAIGAKFVDLGALFASKVSGTVAPAAAASGQRLTTQTDAGALQGRVFALGDAVAINDEPAIREHMRQLRLPFALDEMTAAYRDGQIERGKTLAAEVEKLCAVEGDEPTKARRVTK